MFAPGQSGNPGGRPKENAEVKELARSHGVEAITRLVELMRGEDVKTAKAAADSLLDRGFGKPAQAIIGDSNEDPIMLSMIQRSVIRPDTKD